MTHTESTKPLDWFVDSLLQTSGQLMLIVDHMARHASDAAPKSIDETLRELLSSVLESELQGRDPSEFATAASLLAEVRHLIGDELFLVEDAA
jgi:hypothetical protein